MEKDRIILDTSAYSALLRGDVRIKESLRHVEEIAVNPVILGELLAGFAGGKRAARNRTILRRFLSSARVRLLPIDEETSERYAAIVSWLRAEGTPIPTNDLWIAATAMQHGLKVLTTDAHYLRVPQVITEFHAPGQGT